MDLPLFIDRDPLDDAPLISLPSAPRQPLSVRRAQPAIPRTSERSAPALQQRPRVEESEAPEPSEADEPALERAVEPRRAPRRAHSTVQRDPRSSVSAAPADAWQVAPVINRFGAGLVDVLILAAIDGAVLFSTLRVLGLGLGVAEVKQLPPIPMILFLLLLDGGYLTIFTVAGGQTIGKMIAGIKVISRLPDDDEGLDRYSSRVTMGSAVLRASAYLVSLLPAGLGFAAILFDRDGRALHDRLAETRVVQA